MGDFARAINTLLPVRTKATSPVRSTIPVGTSWGMPSPAHSYESFAREGYGGNELVYAAIEARATSAAEPKFAAWRGGEQLETHPVLDLLERPNPFLTGYTMSAGLMMYRDIAGNAFLFKERSGSGKLVELWPLRPDRMFPVADPDRFLKRWDYKIGGQAYPLAVEDVIHFKTRNPLNEFLGMSPLAPAASRIDIDNWMRQFVGAFFRNAGVPAGLLNVQRELDDDEREMIRNRFRDDYGGPAGWHNLLVIDGAQASYEAMGRDLGQRGLVVPDLDKISEARVAMVLQVPLSILGAVLGAESSSYANRKQDWTTFWEGTLSPIYRDLTDTLTNGLKLEYRDVDRIGYDLATVRALQPDVDALHIRLRADMESGGITREEFRNRVGYGPPPTEGTYIIKTALAPMKIGQEPAPVTLPSQNGQVPAVGTTNGSV